MINITPFVSPLLQLPIDKNKKPFFFCIVQSTENLLSLKYQQQHDRDCDDKETARAVMVRLVPLNDRSRSLAAGVVSYFPYHSYVT